MDARAQLISRNLAVILLSFLGSVVAVALVWVFLQQAWDPMISMASTNASSGDAQTGIKYAKRGWSRILFVVLVMLLTGGIAGSAAVGRGR